MAKNLCSLQAQTLEQGHLSKGKRDEVRMLTILSNYSESGFVSDASPGPMKQSKWGFSRKTDRRNAREYTEKHPNPLVLEREISSAIEWKTALKCTGP